MQSIAEYIWPVKLLSIFRMLSLPLPLASSSTVTVVIVTAWHSLALLSIVTATAFALTAISQFLFISTFNVHNMCSVHCRATAAVLLEGIPGNFSSPANIHDLLAIALTKSKMKRVLRSVLHTFFGEFWIWLNGLWFEHNSTTVHSLLHGFGRFLWVILKISSNEIHLRFSPWHLVLFVYALRCAYVQ